MDRNLVLAARFVVALVWLYEGLWRKLWKHSPDELRVLANIFPRAPFPLLNLLLAMGCAELMIAFGVLAGWSPRFLAGIQILLLLSLDGGGLALGKGSLGDPLALLIKDLPFLLCILMVGQVAGTSKSDTRKAAPRSKKPATSAG